MTLTDFLLARIAEDEARATSDGAAYSMHWPECLYPGDMPGFCDCDLRARVLADCEAKRQIVDLHACQPGAGEAWDPVCSVDGYGLVAPDKCDTLRALAAVYADHSGYRDEWRP